MFRLLKRSFYSNYNSNTFLVLSLTFLFSPKVVALPPLTKTATINPTTATTAPAAKPLPAVVAAEPAAPTPETVDAKALDAIFGNELTSKTVTSATTNVLLMVKINQRDTNQVTIFWQTASGKLLVSKEDLEKWQINIPAKLSSSLHDNKIYYLLDDLPGAKYVVDHKHMVVDITFPGELYNQHEVDFGEDTFIKPTKSPLGGFLNYDLMAQKSDSAGLASATQMSGIFSAHAFNSFGLISSDFLATRTSGENTSNSSSDANKTVRLNSAWTVDDPDKMRSIIAGDSFSNTGMWGKSVDFGGIHWGTNFSTQPHFIQYPLPSARGVATLPSAVDLYVNNALVSKKDVTEGPFNINTIPVITGAGTLSVVTTDLIGRQQVINMPYYVSGSILKPGLHDYAYDAGFVRENYGANSNDYGKPMVAATDRVGITNDFTGEWRAEAMSTQQALGMGGSYLLPKLGVFNLATAVSTNKNQKLGALALLGFQRQAFNAISYGVNAQVASTKFRQIGLQEGGLSPSFTGQVFVGIPLHKQGSLGLSYIQQNNRISNINNVTDNGDHVTDISNVQSMSNTNLVSVSYSRSLGKNWSLGVSTLANVQGKSNKAGFITLSRGFGARTSANLGGTLQSGQNQGTAHLMRSLPAGSGWGYDLNLQSGQQNNYQAALSGQNRVGTYTATVAQQSAATRGYRLEGSGAVAELGGHPYLSRSIGDGFAVVQVPNYENVRVYNSNQEVGRTDKHGNAFVPNLLPYDNNSLRIESNDLPLNARIDGTEMKAIPYKQSGLVVKFPVEPYYGGVVKLLQASGEVVPAGAVITPLTNNLRNESFPVAEDGEAYVTGLKLGANYMRAEWDGKSCQFTINYTQVTEVLPKLGDILCVSK